MFCVYNNFYLLFNKNTYFYKQNINSIKNEIKYFYFFINNNSIITSNKFNSRKSINLILNNKNNYIFYFNKFSLFYFKVFSSFLIFFNRYDNFLFIDLDYKHIIPFYNYNYGLKNVYNNKNYFFLKKSFLTINNWLYFYNEFLKKFNINLLIFLEYNNFYKFLNIFKKFNKPIIALMSYNNLFDFVDYPIFTNYLNISKIILYNYISFFYFNSINIKIYKNKIKYFNFFINYFK